MSDAFDVPTEISDVTIVGPLPVPVTGTFIPSGTQDVNIVSSITLDVTGPLTDTELRATPVPVTIPTPVPVTQSTSPWITDGSGTIQPVSGTVAVSNFPAVQPVSGTVTALQGTTPWVTDGSGTVQPVSGTVSVNNFPSTQSVTQGTSPWVVSGTVTTSPNVNVHDGTGVSISSTGSSLNVDVTNTVPVTGPLTDAQLRAVPVPISGTVAATQSGTWNINNISGTVSLPTGAAIEAKQTQPGVDIGDVTVNNAAGAAAVNIQDGGNSITVDGTVNVGNFPATQPVSGTVTSNQGTPTTTANRWPVQITDGTDLAQVSAAGAVLVDGSATTQPVSGTVTVTQATGTNLHTVLDSGTLTSITNALPAGTNVIGHVITDTGSTTVVTGNVTVVQPTGTNLHVVVDSAPTTSVTQGTSPWVSNVTQFGSSNVVTGTGTSGAGIPRVTVSSDSSLAVNNAAGASAVNIQDGGNSITVDGTVTANQGTANTVGNAWPIKLTDGTDTAAVEALGNVYSATDSRLFTINNKTYGISLDINAATGGADNTQILVRNPTGSGKILYFYTISAGIQINNVFITYKVFASPTITTNGTAQTPVSLNIGGGAAAAVALINTLPTVSASGSAISSRLMSQNGTGVELTQNGIIALNPNNSMLITANPQSNNRVSTYTIHWAEI